MGKKSSSYNAPAPDPNIGLAAMKQAEMGEKQLDFMTKAYAEQSKRQAGIDALSAEVTRGALDTQREQAGWARQDRDRYQKTIVPLENEFISEARQYDSVGRQQARSEEAAADVLRSASDQKKAAARSNAAMGIDPRSGRYRGVEREGEVNTALAAAGARNNARNQVRQQGLALRADAINMGRGLPAQSAQAAALGLTAGNSALGSATTANDTAMGNYDLMSNGYGAAAQGYAGQASTLNSLYGNQLAGYQAQQQASANASAGLGQTIGAVAGIAAMFM